MTATRVRPNHNGGTIHRCTEEDVRAETLCCHRSPMDLPDTDGYTRDANLVTCGNTGRTFALVRLVPAEEIADEQHRRRALTWMRSQLLHEALQAHRSWTVVERVHYRLSSSPSGPGLVLVSVAVRTFPGTFL